MLAPAILKASRELGTLPPYEVLPAALEIIKSLWHLDFKFEVFYRWMLSEQNGLLYWTVPSSGTVSLSSDTELPDQHAEDFWFPGLEIAQTMVLYWAAMALMRSGMMSLYRLVASLPAGSPGSGGEACLYSTSGATSPVPAAMFDVSTLPPLGPRVDVTEMARNVLKSVEFCLDESMLMSGRMIVIGPLHMIIDTLKEYSMCANELGQAKAALARVYNSGLPILKTYGRL